MEYIIIICLIHSVHGIAVSVCMCACQRGCNCPLLSSTEIVITNISPPPAAVDTALIIATVVVPLLLISSLHS